MRPVDDPEDDDELEFDLVHPLDKGRGFIDRIIYATDTQKDAMDLLFGVSHTVESFTTVARGLITGLRGSGKTTWLDAAMCLANNPWKSDPTPAAIKNKFKEDERPTPVFDEIGQTFGPNGTRGRGSPFYKIMLDGYRNDASLSFGVDQGVEEVSSYGVAIMAGKGSKVAPDDLRDRSIIIRMNPKPDSVTLEDSLDAGVREQGKVIGKAIHSWVRREDTQDLIKEAMTRNPRRIHPKLTSRRWQIWGPLFALAYAAGGEWPQRCRDAFVDLALDQSEKPVLDANEQMLLDAAGYLRTKEAQDGEMPRYLRSRTLYLHVRTLDNIVYQAQTERQLAMIMAAGIAPANVLTLPGKKTAKGWHSRFIIRKAELLEASLAKAAEEVDEPEDEYDSFFDEDDEDAETTVLTETTELPDVDATGAVA